MKRINPVSESCNSQSREERSPTNNRKVCTGRCYRRTDGPALAESKRNTNIVLTVNVVLIDKMSLYLLLMPKVCCGLPVQTTITTGSLNSEVFFDYILRIGATVSRSADDNFARPGAQLWGAFELFSEWVNSDKGGIVVGDELWGVEIIEVADHSNITLCDNAARELLDPQKYNVSFMFGPFSSSLTKGVIGITDAAEKTLMTAGSAYDSVWDGTVDYGFGVLYKSGTFYKDPLSLYAQLGAQTGAYLCNLATQSNTCSSMPEAGITAEFLKAGIEMRQYYEIDTTAVSYLETLIAAVEALAAEDVDIIVVHDFSDICIDLTQYARSIDWTPNALFFVVCNNNLDVRTTLGTDLYYSGTYTEWYAEAGFRSLISNYTTLEYQQMYQNEFNHDPDHFSATAFAGGEILVAAIEEQGRRDPSKCLHSPTIADIILHGSWATIKCPIPLVFSDKRQAEGVFVTLQYGTDSTTRLVSTAADLSYPMPVWGSVERTINYQAPPAAVDVIIIVDRLAAADSSAFSASNNCDPAAPVPGKCDFRSALQFCVSNPLKSPLSNCTVHLPTKGRVFINTTLGELSVRDVTGTLVVIGNGATVEPVISEVESGFLSVIIAPELQFSLQLLNFSIHNFRRTALYLDHINAGLIQSVTFTSNTGLVGGALSLMGCSHVTISSSNFIGNNVQTYGGAVYFFNGNTYISFADTLFQRNSAFEVGTGNGGAIYVVEDNSYLSFRSCVFVDNSAQNGGVAYLENHNLNMQFDKCDFRNNSAQVHAGALYIDALNTNLLITICSFLDNRAQNNGGAVFIYSDNDNLLFVNTSFANNRAREGSALYFNSNNQDVVLRSLFFLNNIAGSDGTVFVNSNNNNMLLSSCIFMGNIAYGNGASLYFDSNNQNIEIHDTNLIENWAQSSGNIYLNSNNVDCSMSNMTFIRNRVGRDGAGVGLVSRNLRLTIANSTFDSNWAGLSGGSIHSALMNSEMKIVDSNFSNCSAESYGGAIYLGPDHVGLEISNSNFMRNSGLAGGAILAARFNLDLAISGCNFDSNSAQTGGAVSSFADGVKVTQSHFQRNTAWLSDILRLETQGATLTELTFEHNQGGLMGGGGLGIYVSASVEVVRCTFGNNLAGKGAAVYISASTQVSLMNVSVFNNSANNDGAIYVTDCSDIQMRFMSFFNNIANENGGALYLASTSAVNVTSSIFSGNVVSSGSGSAIFALAVPALQITCNHFSDNEAMRGAGTVYWVQSSSMMEPTGLSSETSFAAGISGSYSNSNSSSSDNWSACPNQFTDNNKALYGNFTATEGVALVIGDHTSESSSSTGYNNSNSNSNSSGGVLHVTSYTDPVPTFTVELRDYYGQVVTSQFSNFAGISVKQVSELTCYDSAGYLAGQVVDSFVSGVATFTALRAFCAPRSTLTVYATTFLDAHAVEISAEFAISFRDCVRGEYYGDSSCIECEEGSFSIQEPSSVEELSELKQSTVCQGCSSDALRCYGDQIVLKAGYWRRSATNVQLLRCPLDEVSCLGGNATGETLCATGYEKTLCAVCSSNYFPVNNKCEECNSSHIFSFTLVIYIVIAIIALGGSGSYLFYKNVYIHYSQEEKDELRRSVFRVRESVPGFGRRDKLDEANLEAVEEGVVMNDDVLGKDEGMEKEKEKQTIEKGDVKPEKEKEKEDQEEEKNKMNVTRMFASWFNDRYSKLVVKFKIMITTFQVVVSTGDSFGVLMPKSFESFCSSFSIVQLNLASIFPFSCSTKFTVIDELILQVLLPIAISVLLLIGFFIHYTTKRKRIQQNRFRKRGDKAKTFAKIKNKYLNLFLFLTYLILPSITTSIFQIFLCTDVDPDDEDDQPSDTYMTADLSISCDSDYSNDGVILGAISVLVYPIGIPLLYFYFLKLHQVEIQTRDELVEVDIVETSNPIGLTETHIKTESVDENADDKTLEERPPIIEKKMRPKELSNEVALLSFLWGSYSPKHWYFEIVETARRLLLTAVLSVVNPSTSQQSVFACFISLAFIKLYSSCKPYSDPYDNYLAEIGQYQIFFTFFFTLILQNDLLPGDIWQEFIGISLISLNMGVIFGFFKCEYDSYYQSKSIDKNDSNGAMEEKEEDKEESPLDNNNNEKVANYTMDTPDDVAVQRNIITSEEPAAGTNGIELSPVTSHVRNEDSM